MSSACSLNLSLSLSLIKPHTSSWTSISSPSSSSSSFSSPLSESNHTSISTRKARARRKRPNQAYNEAASILSTAYPKLFAAKHLPTGPEFSKLQGQFLFEPSALLTPPPKSLQSSNFRTGSRNWNSIEDPRRRAADLGGYSEELCGGDEESFSARSILDEEIDEGIDCVMGKLSMESLKIEDTKSKSGCCYGYPMGLGFDFESRAMRNADGGGGDEWWRFAAVDLADLTPKVSEVPVGKKATARRKKLGSGNGNEVKSGRMGSGAEEFGQAGGELRLKLNYDGVLKAWSERGSPFCGDRPAARLAGRDVQTDLFPLPDDGVGSNATLQPDHEKRPGHLLPKKIRCRVKKVNTNQRPRFKGRFCESTKSNFLF
ncbi:Protein CHLOROPLAST IMPORT APPARATUS 2 [Striga hermonthica]|uniref:Protein CHLOROPLAST IMPORT APPARATUS 2 n=1 Tax=Striga hermonthica TaxID=68872 RepID=A0A9N7N4G5_STRHE|nr:Protein CHLOROPLAST IMPORT APPARATUS 2 [Striga hermonthica]